MKEEEFIKAKMMFLGLVYFHSNAGFSREEIRERLEREFKYVNLEKYNGNVKGEAGLDEPYITLYAELGHKLDSFEFDSNIKKYRSVSLHELIHKFFTSRNEKGEVKGTGLLKLLDRDSKFAEYLRASKVYQIMKSTNLISRPLFNVRVYENEFGRGANEAYTEWYRKNVLKNDENMAYKKITSVMDEIQEQLEQQGENSIDIMEKFSEGDYQYIFEKLNMSKDVGIMFITSLDYVYQKEYEQERAKKYLSAMALAKNLIKEKMKRGIDKRKENLLEKTQEFCREFEEEIKKSKEFKRCKTSEDFQKAIKSVLKNNYNGMETVFQKIQQLLSRTGVKREENKVKLELSDIEDLQKGIFSEIQKDLEKPVFEKIRKGISKVFNKDSKKQKEKKRKVKNDPTTISKGKKLKVGTNGIGVFALVNSKMKKIAKNMSTFVAKIKNSLQEEKKSDKKITEKRTRSNNTINNRCSSKKAESKSGSIERDASTMEYAVEDSIKDKIGDIKNGVSDDNVKIAAIMAILIAIGVPTGIVAGNYIKEELKRRNTTIETSIDESKENKEIEDELPIVQQDEIKEQQEEEKTEVEKQEVEEMGIMEKYFKDGICLEKGESVYRSSYKNDGDSAVMIYDHDNLYCESVRVIKDGTVLQEGDLTNIDELYQFGMDDEADVMMRTGVLNEDGSVTYIAWCDLKEMIEDKENNLETKDVSETATEEFER